jgi:oligopeptide transport system substrate-binding protein
MIARLSRSPEPPTMVGSSRVTILSKCEASMSQWMRCGSLLLTILLAGCQPNVPSDQTSDGVTRILRRGIGGEPSSLDPAGAVDTYSFEVIRDLYEGLTTEAADGTLQPGVAATWEISPAGTEYTFKLRENAKWSNGQKVRAQDFVSAWRRVVDPKRASPVADLLRPIANAAEIIAGQLPPEKLSAYAQSDDRLVVQLKEPAPFFLQLLTHSATFPIYGHETPSKRANNWVSNGAYVLADWVPGASLRLKKNIDYWDHDNVRITEVEYIPISDESSELNRYRAGQLDVTQSVPPSAIPLIRKEFPDDLSVAPFLGTVYYALNLRTQTPFGNQLLRQALAMSIDRMVLTKTVLNFGQQPAYGFVPPGTWNYDQQNWSWKSMSDAARIAESRSLYATAGYSANKPLHLRILINANPEIKKLSVAIASMWKEELGVNSDLIDEEYRVFLDSRKDASRWDVARLSWVADYNDAGNFLDIFRRGSPNNDAGYSNPQFDTLLDGAATTPDPTYRKKLLEKAENLMLSSYPVIPIYFYSSKRLIKPYVKGARSNPLNRLYSKHLFFESK